MKHIQNKKTSVNPKRKEKCSCKKSKQKNIENQLSLCSKNECGVERRKKEENLQKIFL